MTSSPAPRPEHCIGIDIGGTKMLGVVVAGDRPTDVLATHRTPTPEGPDALVDSICSMLEEMDAPAGPVGIGIPGLVDHDDVFRYGPNLGTVSELAVGDIVAERTGRAVAVDNDATCATVAEFRGGSAQGRDDGLLLTLGTGIGGGLVVGGAIQRGAHGFAGEVGHMLVDPAGPWCPCGRRGCWERYASGSGLGRLARDAAVGGRLGDVVGDVGGDPESVKGEDVVAAARAGDDAAGTVLDEFAWWVAAGIANLIDVLDPGIVVLGGGVIGAADVLMDRVRDAVPAQVLARAHRPPVDIVAATFGERAGAVGAAVTALDASS